MMTSTPLDRAFWILASVIGSVTPAGLATEVFFDPSLIDAGMQLVAPVMNQSSSEIASSASTWPSSAQDGTGSSTEALHARFGAEGSWRWQLLGGFADDFDAAQQLDFGASLSWFFVDDLSIDFQVEGDYIQQPVKNAWGIGGTLLLRWHAITADTWSIYGDLGSGILGTTVNTPAGGTSFNFTPQAGGGVSFEIAPDVRLMVGARWYHISNANTGDSNPGRNSLMGYVMISLPF